MIKLTDRQQQVLNCIKEYIDTTGFPPTRADIAKELGFRSPNAAEDHIRALERKGVIEITSGASRGIRLLGEHEPTPTGLPLIGQVAAGSPILAEQHVESYLDIKGQCFAPSANYLLRVKGDSMIDVGIFDGDLVAVKQQKDGHNGQIIVARIEDEVTVKRLKKEKGKVLLIAENPNFSPIQVDQASGEFAIEGLVVGVIRQQVH